METWLQNYAAADRIVLSEEAATCMGGCTFLLLINPTLTPEAETKMMKMSNGHPGSFSTRTCTANEIENGAHFVIDFTLCDSSLSQKEERISSNAPPPRLHYTTWWRKIARKLKERSLDYELRHWKAEQNSILPVKRNFENE